MGDQPDSQAKVDDFKAYLKKVSQHIAGGVRPENLKEIAPTLCKHCNFALHSTSLENNITITLQKDIEKVFREYSLTAKIRDLEEFSGKATDRDCQLFRADPSVIRKYWLQQRRAMLRKKLQGFQQQTQTLSGEINRRRAVMERHINTMHRIQNTQLKKFLLS